MLPRFTSPTSVTTHDAVLSIQGSVDKLKSHRIIAGYLTLVNYRNDNIKDAAKPFENAH
jgi:hypothetical protein